jgi:hypothetical protein
MMTMMICNTHANESNKFMSQARLDTVTIYAKIQDANPRNKSLSSNSMEDSPSSRLSSSASQEIPHILQHPEIHNSLPLASRVMG